MGFPADTVVINAANKTSLAGAVTSASIGGAEMVGTLEFLGTYSSEIAAGGVISGVFFGFVGLVVQSVFVYRRDKREKQESTWRMGIDPDRRRKRPDDDKSED